MERAYTFTKKHKVLYEWKINEMKSRIKNTGTEDSLILVSPKFSTGAKIKDTWSIELYFNNANKRSNLQDELSIYLTNLHTCNVTATVTFFILNNNQERVSIKDYYHNFQPNKSWGCGEYIEKRKILREEHELIPNNTLTVCAEVIVCDDDITLTIENQFNISNNQMIADYRELYNSKVNSDVTVIIADKEFQAHKIILSARSPVLAAMFAHDMVEKKSNQVSIPDITPETFENLLHYIYTDEVTDLDAVAGDLLEAADKYQLPSLKEKCEESLSRSLNCENAGEIMVLADRHNAKKLLDYVIKFIAINASDVTKSDGFKKIEELNSSLGFELFKKLADLNSQDNQTKITHSC
ncbi:speckle-type POZ protein-like [Microplitis mediator]|uniref:speckle-type POZ protein-like n=1 Tax=Microplitis mediator TaxID=375433 RepID=UPI00255215FE|nr:speckle-type POZ protein-like [Microplitis mediator]